MLNVPQEAALKPYTVQSRKRPLTNLCGDGLGTSNVQQGWDDGGWNVCAVDNRGQYYQATKQGTTQLLRSEYMC